MTSSFMKLHLDYGDIIFDMTHCDFFYQRLESLQNQSSLAIAVAIKGSSTKKINQ